MEQGAKVTHGERVAAMIMNGLGFIDNRLYLFPEFLKDKPVDILFGRELKAEWFNDDALVRCLDAISEYGVTKLFTEVSFQVGHSQGLLGKSANLDTTTLTLHGSYEATESETDFEENHVPQPMQGYAKSGRHDLKQMVLLLATTGAARFPIWMKAHSGNASDKKTLPAAAQKMHALYKGLTESPEFRVYFLFRGVNELNIKMGNQNKRLIVNVTGELKKILGHCGSRAKAIYLGSG